jgi:hypothetical protein
MMILHINQRSEGHAFYATRPFAQYIRRGRHIEAAAVTVLTAGEGVIRFVNKSRAPPCAPCLASIMPASRKERAAMRVTEREPRDVVDLARRARAECDALQRDHYREAVSIAAALGRPRRSVQEWAYAYR